MLRASKGVAVCCCGAAGWARVGEAMKVWGITITAGLPVVHAVASRMIDLELNAIPLRVAARPRKDAPIVRIEEHIVCPECMYRFERSRPLKKQNERKLCTAV